MLKILIESHYMPCIEYFTVLYHSKHIVLEVKEHFIKQTYRNRAFILGANGIDRLTIPLIKANSKKKFDKVEIDYTEKWQNKHWRGIQSSYGKAPFFEFYEDEFKKVIYTPFQYLNELNTKILVICLKYLRLNLSVTQSRIYENRTHSTLGDFRNLIGNKTPKTSIQLQKYIQVFGNNFIPNLSILDLLFSEGLNANNILKTQANENKHLIMSSFLKKWHD